MKALFTLAVLLLSLPVAAAPTPVLTPDTQVPGVKPETSSKMLTVAIDLARSVVSNYSERFGYRLGEKISEPDTMCLMYIGLLSQVDQALTIAPRGSHLANGLNKAKVFAQRGMDDWCGPRGGVKGLLMFAAAVRDDAAGTLNVTGPKDVKHSISWAARAGILVPAMEAAGAAAATTPLIHPGAVRDVRPPALRKTDPNDVL